MQSLHLFPVFHLQQRWLPLMVQKGVVAPHLESQIAVAAAARARLVLPLKFADRLWKHWEWV